MTKPPTDHRGPAWHDPGAAAAAVVVAVEAVLAVVVLVLDLEAELVAALLTAGQAVIGLAGILWMRRHAWAPDTVARSLRHAAAGDYAAATAPFRANGRPTLEARPPRG